MAASGSVETLRDGLRRCGRAPVGHGVTISRPPVPVAVSATELFLGVSVWVPGLRGRRVACEPNGDRFQGYHGHGMKTLDTSGRVALVLIALMIGVGGVEALLYAAGETGMRNGGSILVFLAHIVVAGLVLRDTANRNRHAWRHPHCPDWNPMFPESSAWILATFLLPLLFLPAYLIDRPFAPMRPGASVASPTLE